MTASNDSPTDTETSDKKSRNQHKRGDFNKTVTIEVNSRKVEMPVGPATGHEIKAAAIKQEVAIQLNFVLQLELPNGTSQIIGDDDKVTLRDYLSFTAIAPDDNS